MLTPRFVSTVTVQKRTDYSDSTVTGLVLRVTPAGAKSWCLRYRTTSGQPRRYTLGKAADLSLSKARLKARQALHAVASGHDPSEAKRQGRKARTMGALVEDYLTLHAKVYKRSWRQDEWMLKNEVLPYWKDRKAQDITRRDVRERIEGIVARGVPIVANRVLACIRKVFNFGISRDWVEANPATNIDKPCVEVSRDRVLSDDELRLFWTLCDREPPALAAFLRLRLVTAQRGGELARLKWADVTEAAFTIPENIAKNGRAHRVPLTTTSQCLLDGLPRLNEWLFPGRSGRMAISVLNEAAHRINDRMTTVLQADANFRGHDLRRTAATRMAEAGIPQAHIARVLNHVESGPRATQVYQRYEFDKEKKVALETWDRELNRILSEESATGTVRPFVRK
jgi:integrase